jgi:hypothetical protein
MESEMADKTVHLGEAALLQAQAEKAESNIKELQARIARAHESLAKEQARCQKSGDIEGYKRAVAEEAALNAAYQRLETAIGRMHFGATGPSRAKKTV